MLALCMAGISNGLVRMSVGITGTLEARWAQLEEAFYAVAQPAEPAFRAAQARRMLMFTHGSLPACGGQLIDGVQGMCSCMALSRTSLIVGCAHWARSEC